MCVLDLLREDRFVDRAPAEVYATLHADRGPSMKTKATALLLADLSVTKSHSRQRAAGLA